MQILLFICINKIEPYQKGTEKFVFLFDTVHLMFQFEFVYKFYLLII